MQIIVNQREQHCECKKYFYNKLLDNVTQYKKYVIKIEKYAINKI